MHAPAKQYDYREVCNGKAERKMGSCYRFYTRYRSTDSIVPGRGRAFFAGVASFNRDAPETQEYQNPGQNVGA